MKIGVADYGLNVWDGGAFDYEERWIRLKGIGYEGLERLTAHTEADAIAKAARMRRLGMDFATCLAPTPELCIQWTAAFGKSYVWTSASAGDFDTFCRQVNIQAEACDRWGIRVALHNHMGTVVETQPQLEAFLTRCPRSGLILDTAHLAAAGGDPVAVVRACGDRLAAIHVKDWLELKPGAANWWERGRFCELGAGNINLDNAAVVKALRAVGYDGWVFVEHDTHLREPLEDLKTSRDYLKKAGI